MIEKKYADFVSALVLIGVALLALDVVLSAISDPSTFEKDINVLISKGKVVHNTILNNMGVALVGLASPLALLFVVLPRLWRRVFSIFLIMIVVVVLLCATGLVRA